MNNERIPVSVVTGFLGSGKTTLINQLLRDPSMANTALIINEFGAISIDTDLVQSTDDTVMELGNGCLCCSIKDDLATTLTELLEQRRDHGTPIARVLIETTGLANAGPIVATVLGDPTISQRFSLDRVVTTVDGVNGPSTLDRHPESVEQVAISDVLVITKTDLIDDQTTSDQPGLRDRLRQLNPGAVQLAAQMGRLDVADVFGAIANHDPAYLSAEPWKASESHDHDEDEHHHHQHDEHKLLSLKHDDHISSFCLTSDQPVPLSALQTFWTHVSAEAGPNLLRVKGLVNVRECDGEPAVIQGAQEVFHDIQWLDNWPSDDRRSRIVFIGWDLDRDFFQTAFEKVSH